MVFLPLLRNWTYSLIPPVYLKFNSLISEDLLSFRTILTPVFKKANSLNLFSTILNLKSIFLKILFEGRNVMDVPVKYASLIFSDSPVVWSLFLTYDEKET